MIKAIDYCKNVFDGTHETPKYVEEGYKFLTSKNIMDGYLDKTNAFLISKEDYDSFNIRSQVHKWDVLFSMIGSVGNVCLVTDDDIDFAVKNMGVFSCGDEYKAKWLYYYFKSPYAKQLIRNHLNGAVQKFLGLDKLRTFPVPEFTEDKKRIVFLLSCIDDKIALNNKINTELENMAKTIYDYWFTQFDFPDKNGHPYKTFGGQMVYNETLKKDIPAGWEVGRLSDIANITMGQSPEGSTYNENGIGTIFYQGSTDFGNRSPSIRVYTTAPTRFAKKNDILMSVRAPVGTLNIANTDCCIGRGLAALNSKINSISYLYCVMRNFQRQFEVLDSIGTTFGSITKDDLFGLQVIIPSEEVINEFDKIGKPLFEEQTKLNEENEELTKLRDYLLPLLMNGQIEVL